MKKTLFFAFFACHLIVLAGEPNGGSSNPQPITIHIESRDDANANDDCHRAPVRFPKVYFDSEANVLSFSDALIECTIEFIAVSGETAYSAIIPDGATEFQLPNNLTGEYELRITRGNYVFVGCVNL